MIQEVLLRAAFFWRDTKDFVEGLGLASNMVLHIAAGLALFFIFRALIQRPRRSSLAWLITLSFALLNELVDITTERWPNISEQYLEAGIDLAATMILPALLAVALSQRS